MRRGRLPTRSASIHSSALYKAERTEKLVRTHGQLDYPPKKLDIKLLLKPICRTAPPSRPSPASRFRRGDRMLHQNQPAACNFAAQARGFCVIMTEDAPEPDPIGKGFSGIARFMRQGFCIQAKLTITSRHNLLTPSYVEYRLISTDTERNHSFRGRCPGGTSNHPNRLLQRSALGSVQRHGRLRPRHPDL